MKRASAPDATRPRAKPSYQTLCPTASSSRSGFATCPPAGGARLERADLREATRVPLLAVEPSGEERLRELQREGLGDDERPEREHVHVVVLDPLVRRVVVVADARADAGDLVRGDRARHAHPGDEGAPLHAPTHDPQSGP